MNYHILKTDEKLKTATVIFHFPVPTGNNAVGISWQDAFLTGINSNPTSELYNIDATELGEIKAGSIIEHQATVGFSSINLTNAQRLAEIVAKYDIIKDTFFAKYAITLNFTGKAGDIS